MELSEVVIGTAGLGLVALAARALCARLLIPYTVFLVVLGILMGWAAQGVPGLEYVLALQLTPEIVLFVFLPILIFESAFNLNARELVRCLAPILTLAVPALLLSSLVVGLGLHGLFGMDLVAALLFGILISATDPVAVIAVFRELGAPRRLTMLVEGESLFNDAVAIVLCNILLGLGMSGGLEWAALGEAGHRFLYVFCGGLLVGGVAGLLVCELFHLLRAQPYTMMLVSLCLAYLIFAVAEHVLYVSGVMAVLAAAMAVSFTMLVRASQAAGQAMVDTWELIAIAGNALLFVLVGLSVDVGRLAHHLPLVGCAIVLVLLGRAAAVYLLLPLVTRLFRFPGASTSERHIIWWGGLKGGLALAIALSVPHALPGRDAIIDMTVGVVLFFLLVNGTTIRVLMRHLGLDRVTREELAEQRNVLQVLRERGEAVLRRLGAAGVLQDDHEVRVRIRPALSAPAPAPADSSVEALRLPLLRLESREHHALYDMGLLNTYTYLELCSDMHVLRESCLAGCAVARGEAHARNRFQWLEHVAIGWLRRLDLTAGLLERYQDFRLSNSICRRIALLLGCRRALESLASADKPDGAHAELEAEYRRLEEMQSGALRQLAGMFADYYQQFVERLACRVTIGAARNRLEAEYHRGLVGSRNYLSIDWRLQESLRPLLATGAMPHRLGAGELISEVPLMEGLPAAALERLVWNARIMHFLEGDEIIRRGEYGDAMYIVHSGCIGVYREGAAGPYRAELLQRGGFFGEVALLGNRIRTATVRSETPSVLLRLRRHDVLEVARAEPRLRQRLLQVSRERSS